MVGPISGVSKKTSMISVFIIIIFLVILLTVFVGRATELIIMKIQQKNMRPVMEKNLEQEPINPVRQTSP
jgi:K+-transporting ATPase A subunit